MIKIKINVGMNAVSDVWRVGQTSLTFVHVDCNENVVFKTLHSEKVETNKNIVEN